MLRVMLAALLLFSQPTYSTAFRDGQLHNAQLHRWGKKKNKDSQMSEHHDIYIQHCVVLLSTLFNIPLFRHRSSSFRHSTHTSLRISPFDSFPFHFPEEAFFFLIRSAFILLQLLDQ